MTTEHTAWCQRLMDTLQDGGVWGVPRSALIFTKRGKALALTSRMPYHAALPMTEGEWTSYQQDDYEACKEQFEAAGFEVRDDTAIT